MNVSIGINIIKLLENDHGQAVKYLAKKLGMNKNFSQDILKLWDTMVMLSQKE
jgi:DNA-binding IclR family transcriptional regulator